MIGQAERPESDATSDMAIARRPRATMESDGQTQKDDRAVFTGFIRVRGARDYKLKNIALKMPRDAAVVFTGVSGSGKSSRRIAPTRRPGTQARVRVPLRTAARLPA